MYTEKDYYFLTHLQLEFSGSQKEWLPQIHPPLLLCPEKRHGISMTAVYNSLSCRDSVSLLAESTKNIFFLCPVHRTE